MKYNDQKSNKPSSAAPMPYPWCQKLLKVSPPSVSEEESDSASSAGTVKRGSGGLITKKKAEESKMKSGHLTVDELEAAEVGSDSASAVTYLGSQGTKWELEDDDDGGASSSVLKTDDGDASMAGTASEAGGDLQLAIVQEEKSASVLDLKCMCCKEKVILRTQFLLLDDKEDWCGKLWGQCLKCSGLDAKAFTKLQRKRWHVRATILHGKQNTLRVLSWQKLDAHLKVKFPGSSNKERRSLASSRIRVMGMAMALSSFAENVYTQQAFQVAHATYMTQIDEVCSNIGLPSAQIKHWETDFLTSLSDTIQVSYLCRKKDCGFYGMNDQWVKHETRYHFRCPRCGMQYSPWKDAAKFYPFQKVISITHPSTGERWVIPAKWPDSAEDSYLQDLMRAKAMKIETDADLNDFVQGKIESLEKMLQNIGIPAAFQQFKLSSDTKYLLNTTNGFGKTQYTKLEEDGYWGNILDPVIGNQEPFNEWTEFAAIFASLVSAGEQFVKGLKV
jgi:hypothetical protein